MKPTFLLIGSGKCGTTSLWDLLNQHPQIFMSRIKEPSFFSEDDAYARGWAWYEGLFCRAALGQQIGEASNSYTATGIFPKTVDRIAHHLPDAKFIYIVRNPFRRAESDWMESQRIDSSQRGCSFAEFLRTDSTCRDKTHFWRQINAYRNRFSDDRILVLFFEDFVSDTVASLRRCYTFLDVDPDCWPQQPGRARRVSGAYVVDGPLMRLLRRMHMDNLTRDLLPSALRSRVARVFSSAHVQERPVWDDETRAYWAGVIGDDNRRFLSDYGKSPEFWGL